MPGAMQVQAEEAARLEELHRSEKLQNVQNDEVGCARICLCWALI